MLMYYCVEDSFQGWDDSDWGWKDDDEHDDEETKDAKHLSWLQECYISLSPASDLMAVARGDRIVHLTRKSSN